jgi:hypothetical protein
MNEVKAATTLSLADYLAVRVRMLEIRYTLTFLSEKDAGELVRLRKWWRTNVLDVAGKEEMIEEAVLEKSKEALK